MTPRVGLQESSLALDAIVTRILPNQNQKETVKCSD